MRWSRLLGQYSGYQVIITSSKTYTIDYCCVEASMFRRCSYMRSALLMSSVPILHVLCSRRYTAVTVENRPPPTSKTDSAQKFGLEYVLELLLLFITWLIMPCDASWWRCFLWVVCCVSEIASFDAHQRPGNRFDTPNISTSGWNVINPCCICVLN